jgi:hypothetical protein
MCWVPGRKRKFWRGIAGWNWVGGRVKADKEIRATGGQEAGGHGWSILNMKLPNAHSLANWTH